MSARYLRVRISAVAPDRADKGCRLHVGSVEIALRPDHLGGIVCRPIFSSTSDDDLRIACAEMFRQMEDPDLLDRLRDALERGMLYLMSIDGQKQIHPRPNPRGSQIRTVRDQARFRISRINLINMAFESWGGAGRDRNLVLDSSVRATFHEGALDSISYVAKSEPPVKQITLSIPKDDFEALRREAAELGVSVSALCSRWIRERVVSHQPHS